MFLIIGLSRKLERYFSPIILGEFLDFFDYKLRRIPIHLDPIPLTTRIMANAWMAMITKKMPRTIQNVDTYSNSNSAHQITVETTKRNLGGGVQFLSGGKALMGADSIWKKNGAYHFSKSVSSHCSGSANR